MCALLTLDSGLLRGGLAQTPLCGVCDVPKGQPQSAKTTCPIADNRKQKLPPKVKKRQY